MTDDMIFEAPDVGGAETPEFEPNECDAVLFEGHNRLLEELDARLDVEAGLRDVLRTRQHQRLLATIRQELDVEAGLAATLAQRPQPVASWDAAATAGDAAATADKADRPRWPRFARLDRIRRRWGAGPGTRPSRSQVPDRRMLLPVPSAYQLLLWVLVVLDVMVVAWMLSAGDWLDRTSLITAVLTLGGHHLLVLWLAVAGFALLGGMALLTGGFAVVSRGRVPFLVLSALVSVVANAGVLSALLFVATVVLLLTLLGAAFLGRGTVFLAHLGEIFRP